MLVAKPEVAVDSAGTALSDAERESVARLAAALAEQPPRLVDAHAWQEHALRLSARLPVRIREAIRLFRRDPGRDGLLVLTNLPTARADLADTPTVPESVERVATTAAAVACLVSLALGELVAYRQEKGGALVQNVVPVPGRENSQSNAGSTPLELHTENAFHAHRPDFVALFCLRNDHAGTAGTLVSSIRRALPLLPESVREVLREERFSTRRPPSFASGSEVRAHAVLCGEPADPNIRVDFAATLPLDDDAKVALGALREALLGVSANLVLQPGELAFVDNRLCVHGRTPFTPRYDGRDRWLHRTFIHLDDRRTRSHRADNGRVLI